MGQSTHAGPQRALAIAAAMIAMHGTGNQDHSAAQALKVIRRLIAETDNVGRAFPEEARKIHYEEAPKRGIRGQATHEEADALREEGIEFMSVPDLFTRDLN